MAANNPLIILDEVCDLITRIDEGVNEIALLTEKCNTLSERLTEQEEKYNATIGDLDLAKKDKEQQMNGLAKLESECRHLTQQNYKKSFEVKIAEETCKKAEESLRSATAKMAVLTAQNKEMRMHIKRIHVNMRDLSKDMAARDQEVNNICMMSEEEKELLRGASCQGVQELLRVKKYLIDQNLIYKSRIAHLAALHANATATCKTLTRTLHEIQSREDNDDVPPDLVAVEVECVEVKEWRVLNSKVSEAMSTMRMDFLSNTGEHDEKGVLKKIRLNDLYEDCLGGVIFADGLSASENDLGVLLLPEGPKQAQDVNNEEGATGTTQAKKPGVERAEVSSMAKTSAQVAKKDDRTWMECHGSIKKQKALRKVATFLNKNGGPSKRTEEENPFGEGNLVSPGIPVVEAAVEVGDVFGRMSIEDTKKIRAKYTKKGC